jgi:hypothetical protein
MATPVNLANVYTAIVEYVITADRTKRWRNSYDFYSTDAPAEATGILAALATFAGTMVWADTTVESLSVYHWSRGTQPYPNGLPIIVTPLGGAGVASSSWVFGTEQPAAGSEICLRVDKNHIGIGRPGRFFFRNFVPESQISADRGEAWHLVSGTPITEGHWNSILSTTGMSAYITNVPGPGGQNFVTVQYSPKTHTVHGSANDSTWSLIGPTTNKPTRKSHK